MVARVGAPAPVLRSGIGYKDHEFGSRHQVVSLALPKRRLGCGVKPHPKRGVTTPQTGCGARGPELNGVRLGYSCIRPAFGFWGIEFGVWRVQEDLGVGGRGDYPLRLPLSRSLSFTLFHSLSLLLSPSLALSLSRSLTLSRCRCLPSLSLA